MDWISGVDPRAVVHPDAKIGENVTIGPLSIIGPEVEIGDGCWIGPQVAIDGLVSMGAGNKVYPFTTIGFPPQDLKYAGEPTRVVIGDGNIFREGCTVHRGTAGGGALTEIGNSCVFMVLSHIAHDCKIGDHVLFANAGTLAGHVEVGDYATIGAYTGVHQFCRVGCHAFIGGYSVITRDALPYCLTVGNRATCYGINRIGLKRQGFARGAISALERATRAIFRQELRRQDAMKEVELEFAGQREVELVLEFIAGAKRGVIPIRLGQSS